MYAGMLEELLERRERLIAERLRLVRNYMLLNAGKTTPTARATAVLNSCIKLQKELSAVESLINALLGTKTLRALKGA